MTSSASSATWLPAAITRAAVVSVPPAQWVPTAGRHSAPEFAGTAASVTAASGMAASGTAASGTAASGTNASAADTDGPHRGRHAEPEWSREWFDAMRDEDPLDWLGFAALS